MNIVPQACITPAFSEAKRHAGRLFDRQRINIGTQGNHLIAAPQPRQPRRFQIIWQQADAAAL